MSVSPSLLLCFWLWFLHHLSTPGGKPYCTKHQESDNHATYSSVIGIRSGQKPRVFVMSERPDGYNVLRKQIGQSRTFVIDLECEYAINIRKT